MPLSLGQLEYAKSFGEERKKSGKVGRGAFERYDGKGRVLVRYFTHINI